MTIKQLIRTQKSLLAEFNRAVVRRRANLKKVAANQLAMRRAAANPNNSTTPQAVRAKKKLYDTIYRSVMNKVSDPRCKRWTRRRGNWGCAGCEASKKMKRICRP